MENPSNNSKSKLQSNLSFSILYQVLLIFIPLFTAPYISRVLGATNIGTYSYTYSVAHYFVLFTMMGLVNYGTRSIANVAGNIQKRSAVFWQIYFLQLMASAIAIFAYGIYILCFKPENTLIVGIEGLYVISAGLDITWFFNGISDFKSITIRNLVIKFLTIAFIFCFVRTENDLWKYTLIMCGGILLSQIIIWFPANKYIIWVKPKFDDVKRHIKPNIILFSSAIAVSIYKIMDKIMIGLMSDYTQVGFYENAEKITNLPTGIISAVGTVMLARMASMSDDEKCEEEKTIQSTLKIMMALAIGISFGLSAISQDLSVVFFGKEFAPTGELLNYLGFVTIFLAWGNVIRTQYLLPHKKDSLIVASVWVGAFINFSINYLLLPRMGAMGAVVGTLVTEACVALIVSIYSSKKLKISHYFYSIIPYLLMGLVMWLIIRAINRLINSISIVEILIDVLVGSCSYIIMLLLYSFAKNDEISTIVKQIIKKKEA